MENKQNNFKLITDFSEQEWDERVIREVRTIFPFGVNLAIVNMSKYLDYVFDYVHTYPTNEKELVIYFIPKTVSNNYNKGKLYLYSIQSNLDIQSKRIDQIKTYVVNELESLLKD